MGNTVYTVTQRPEADSRPPESAEVTPTDCPLPRTVSGMKDAQGVERGACKLCSCSQYCPPDDDSGNIKCVTCSHQPGKHQNLSRATMPSVTGSYNAAATCTVPGCNQAVDFDLNTGREMSYCYEHTQGHVSSDSRPPESAEVTRTDSPLPRTVSVMKDAQGVERGACKLCSCFQYCPPDDDSGNIKCVTCSHQPGKHQNLSSTTIPSVTASYNAAATCAVPGCNQAVDFDLNTGIEMRYCYQHTQGHVSSVYATGETAQVQDEDETYCDGGMVMYIPQQDGFVLSDGGAIVPFQPPSQPVVLPVPMPPTNPMLVHGPQTAMAPVLQTAIPGAQKCALVECPNPCYTDESGRVHECCSKSHATEYHRRKSEQSQQGAIYPPQLPPPTLPTALLPPPTLQQGSPALAPTPLPPSLPSAPVLLPSGQKKCAIPECHNPCFVDASGTVHECCGITHAMEHQRRKAIQQQQQVVKGVTHCLLPECNQLVWPFKNYCGKSHADQGVQRGLVPPMPQADPSAPKDSSMCIIPGCTKKKYSEGGVTHPYCGRGHADLGKKMNIQPTADKPEDQCELPGCQQPKRKEGTRVHDYCCLDHAKQDAPNRAARILTSNAEVKKFLSKFPNLKVTSMVENPAAQPGGELYKRFKQKWDSLPTNLRTTCLAFHGTADRNISSICQNGYDPKLRSGQAYGPGEYFATTPDIPLGYCKGGKRMLLNELLLGQHGTHHTMHGNIVVMKYAEHDLPRFVLTFQ